MNSDRGYKVVRYFRSGKRRTIIARCTISEAQAHCRDPETNSKTATSRTARTRTRRMGPWFDGYTVRCVYGLVYQYEADRMRYVERFTSRKQRRDRIRELPKTAKMLYLFRVNREGRHIVETGP